MSIRNDSFSIEIEFKDIDDSKRLFMFRYDRVLLISCFLSFVTSYLHVLVTGGVIFEYTVEK